LEKDWVMEKGILPFEGEAFTNEAIFRLVEGKKNEKKNREVEEGKKRECSKSRRTSERVWGLRVSERSLPDPTGQNRSSRFDFEARRVEK